MDKLEVGLRLIGILLGIKQLCWYKAIVFLQVQNIHSLLFLCATSLSGNANLKIYKNYLKGENIIYKDKNKVELNGNNYKVDINVLENQKNFTR